MTYARIRSSAIENAFFGAVLACFILSGFAALLYQTAWLRQFSVVFGTSELAVAAVLAAYMGGLALGAALVERVIHRLPQTILTYATLEAGIALTALAVPTLIVAFGDLAPALLGTQATPAQSHTGQAAFYLAMTFVALVMPTALMGATLPLLAKLAVVRDEQIGPRIGLLYGANALGAVAGVVSAGFFFLPQYGLSATVLVGVGANFATFLIAAFMAIIRRSPANTSLSQALDTSKRNVAVKGVSSSDAVPTEATLRPEAARWILPLMLVSGAISFVYEVLWTRLLAHILGGSIYSFSAMLASFLAGIAIGGALAGQASRTQLSAARLFCAVQLVIALASAVIFYWLTSNPPIERGLIANATLAFAIMTPAALFIGATFPLAVRILASSTADSARATARVYAWNTLGAIFGAILAAFVLIPALQFAGAIRAATVANVVVAALAAALILPKRSYALVAATACFALALVAPLREPMQLVASSAIYRSSVDDAASPLFYAVGSSTTVYVNEENGRLQFYTNGLPEAQASVVGAPADRNTQRWLGTLPFILRPSANNVLLVGFGGGIAVEGVPTDVPAIDIVELESAVIEANRAVGSFRDNDPLSDDRVRIFINDARNALLLSDARYDAIVSQPSHPWTPGSANLYTREFFALAHSHLRADGVFVQWINSTFVTEELLRSLCATLAAEFRYVQLFRPDPTELYFIASDSPLIEADRLASDVYGNGARAVHFASIGLPAPEDVLAAWALDERGVAALARGAPVNTDDHNFMAIRSRSQADGVSADALDAMLLPLDPLTRVLADNRVPLNTGYLATRLIATGFERRALALAHGSNSLAERSFIQAIGLRYHGQVAQAERALVQAVAADPENVQARYSLLAPYLGAVAAGQAPSHITSTAQRVTGSAASVILGWRLGQQGQWARLAELDEELSRTERSDLWHPQATKLRLDWRVQVAAATANPHIAEEALEIADALLPVYQSADILALRAAAAHLSGNTRAFAETVRTLSIHTREKIMRARAGQYEISPSEAHLLMRRLQGMTTELDRVTEPTLVERVATITSHAELTIRMLAQQSMVSTGQR